MGSTESVTMVKHTPASVGETQMFSLMNKVSTHGAPFQSGVEPRATRDPTVPIPPLDMITALPSLAGIMASLRGFKLGINGITLSTKGCWFSTLDTEASRSNSNSPSVQHPERWFKNSDGSINLLFMTNCEASFVVQLSTLLSVVLSLRDLVFPFSICHSHSY